MTKLKFLMLLHDRLSGLPQDEVEERLSFYSEMIEDRMEEGLSEEQAVLTVGSVEDIVAQIVADMPLTKIAKEKTKPKRRLKAWEITLLAIGSPIWLSLLIAAVAVVFALYVSLWSLVISLWAVFGSLLAAAIGGMIAGFGFAFGSFALTGIAMVGAAMVCAGLSVLSFFWCKGITKGVVMLTKNMVLGIKNFMLKREVA